MKIGIVAVGEVPQPVLAYISEGLTRIYPDTNTIVLEISISSLESSYDEKRRQHNSTIILNTISSRLEKETGFDSVLGIIDADIFTVGLNYVFGEALSPGKVALVSLWRLKPEFYSADPDVSLYNQRILKETIHEIGHTLGLKHCLRSYCIMHFSNSIFDTDKKQTLLCDQCYLQASIGISNLG